MCGIVGIISKQTNGFRHKDTDLFKQMLYADALRGFDSTGIFGVNKYGNLKMIKAAKDAGEFIKTKAFGDFKTDMLMKYRIVVGHNRAATKGATTDDNAYPFIEKNICLIHNGTINRHKELANTEVDSHAICHAIAENGHMATLPKIDGAYALIWYDADTKNLHIARNDQRPLWLVQTPEADYIASEPAMLIWLIQRVHGIVAKAVYFGVDDIYTYNVDSLDKGYTTETKPKKALPVVASTPSKLQQATKKHKKEKKYGKMDIQKTTGNTSNDDDLPSIGDRIFFSYERSSVQSNTIRIEGLWNRNKKKMVAGYVDISKFTADQIEHMLEYSTEFYGKYRGYSKKRDGKIQLFVEDVCDVKEYLSLNGTIVNDRQLLVAGYCCHECGEILEPEEQEGEFWVRTNNSDNIKEIKCPTCVAKHEHLSKLLEKSCTKESSSSATSSAQGHSVH